MALKPCKECGKEISTKADNCPNCGAPTKGLLQQDIGCVRGCMWIFVAIFALGVIGSLIGEGESGGTGAESSTSSASEERTPSASTKRFMARTVCEEYVKANLKAPSTADFEGASVGSIGADSFRVVGQVDAENSFGAKLRNDYSCETYFTGADVYDNRSWRRLDLQISGR